LSDFAKRFPQDTLVQCMYIPTLRAQLALSHREAAKAITELAPASPCELGQASSSNTISIALYPVYMRGTAYLALRQGKEALVEYQKIMDHRGVVINGPIGVLAHLGQARAYVLTGDTAKAKVAFQDFLGLWKDADADLPVLKQVKSEYAALD